MPNKVNKQYDVRIAIKALVPSLFNILGSQPVSWTKINKGLANHLNKVRKEIEQTGKPVNKEATFYSVIVNKIAGKQESDSLFDFYNRLFITLDTLLSIKDKKHLHKMIVQVLNNFDKGYLNFIGELAVLYKYMMLGEFELLKIEEQITPESNVTADILLRNKGTQSEILIEILNVHLEELDITTYDKIKYHLHSKFTKKTDQKLINPQRYLKIQPVLWYRDHKQLTFLSNFFHETGYKFDNVFDPLTLASIRLGNGEYEHRFDSIKTILNDKNAIF